jgi:uncharacterized ParB-like nuclease family protein
MTSIPGAIDVYQMRPAEMPMTGEKLHQLEEAGKYKVQDVPISKMVPTQTHLNPDAVASYKESIQAGELQESINLVKSEGKYYVYDGHHRIAAAEASGKTHVTAHVFTKRNLNWLRQPKVAVLVKVVFDNGEVLFGMPKESQ